MTNTPGRIRAAREAWQAAMVAYESQRLEVNRLWLAYLDLADPVLAPKIRKLVMRGEKAAIRPADEGLPLGETRPLGPPAQMLPKMRHEGPYHHPGRDSMPHPGETDQGLPFE
jgi:hypothetical protein